MHGKRKEEKIVLTNSKLMAVICQQHGGSPFRCCEAVGLKDYIHKDQILLLCSK